MKQYAEDFESTDALKWRAIIALGRFAGCRGASDLHVLTWDKIRWSSAGELGSVLLEGKTKRKIPFTPILEKALADWYDVTPEGARVFPGMDKNTNTNNMFKKYAHRAGVEIPEAKPWYNLRKSFCTDIMGSGANLDEYRRICGHSPNVALNHYMIEKKTDLPKHAEIIPNTHLSISEARVQTQSEEKNGKRLPESAFPFANYDLNFTSERSVKSSVNGSESQSNRQLQEIYQSSTELNETPQNMAFK